MPVATRGTPGKSTGKPAGLGIRQVADRNGNPADTDAPIGTLTKNWEVWSQAPFLGRSGEGNSSYRRKGAR